MKMKYLIILFMLVSCKYDAEEYHAAVDVAYEDGFNAGEDKGYVEGVQLGKTQGYNAGYNQAIQDAAPDEYFEGVNDGFSVGEAAGFTRGYNQGEVAGYNTGYQDGYNDGDYDGFNDGYNEGYSETYWEGYNHGMNVGISSGYGIGYDDGIYDGYENGYGDAYQEAYEYAYDDGIYDGYDIGFDDGYIDGDYDGYDDGYEDGWFDAGGTSVKRNSGAMLATFLKDLIDFDKLKSPKQVMKSYESQKGLIMRSGGMTVDTKKREAILNSYIVGNLKEQFTLKYGLSDKRSMQVAQLAHHVMKASKAGAVNIETLDSFSKKVMGSSFSEMKEAYSKSLSGDTSQLNTLIDKASKLNDITAAHTLKIMGQIFI